MLVEMQLTNGCLFASSDTDNNLTGGIKFDRKQTNKKK